MRTQNQPGIIKERNNPKGYFGILLADIAWGLQKLGIILENKVLLISKLAKML